MLQVSDEGWAALKQREPIHLAKPIAPPKPEKFRADKHRVEKVRARSHRAGEIDCDEALFERLRRRRKKLADERGVPPYIVFSDVSLRQMARYYPSNENEFARINGVGERKLAEFGKVFIAEIAAHLRTNPRRAFDK